MKKPTNKDHKNAFYQAVMEQLLDRQIEREVHAALQDAVIYGTSLVRVKLDKRGLKVKRVKRGKVQ